MGFRSPNGKGQFWGKAESIVKYRDRDSAVTCAKTAEPIVMPLGLWAQTDPRNHELAGGPNPHEKGQFWGKGHPLLSIGSRVQHVSVS